MKKLKRKSQIKVSALIEQSVSFTDLERAWLILNLHIQQKQLSKYQPCEIENCTLMDIRKGLIVGSGKCPHCHGFIGRADKYTTYEMEL
jgi:hypothetical protein